MTTGIDTLQLVTTRRPFFDQQVRVLERNGVSCTVRTVPGTARERSVREYLRLYLRTLRQTGGFDLIHANYGLTAPLALAQPTRPVVVSLWGTDLFGPYERVSRVAARLADAVVVMSEEMAAAVDCPCHVVPHGIDRELFRPLPQSWAREQVGWRADASHVLFPYDPSREVKAFPRAETVVERAADRLTQPVELHAVSGVDHEQVPIYMNAADAMLLTSRHEGSPNAVKEALACSLPVVAVPVGDVPSLLGGVEGSHVCATDDDLVAALVEVLTTPDRGDGRERSRAFSLDRMGEELVGIYRDVLDQESSRSSTASAS